MWQRNCTYAPECACARRFLASRSRQILYRDTPTGVAPQATTQTTQTTQTTNELPRQTVVERLRRAKRE